MANKMEYLGGTDWENGDVLYKEDLIETIKESTIFSHPIGSVIGWNKDLTGVPTLPGTWVECNGQTLSDADSPLNGEVIPDLNGDNRFLRGNSTSGTTGGQVSQSHRHQVEAYGTSRTGTSSTVGNSQGNADYWRVMSSPNTSTGLRLDTTTINTEPPYMNVVWIMRVK